MNIIRIDSKGRVLIPSYLRKTMGLLEGSEVIAMDIHLESTAPKGLVFFDTSLADNIGFTKFHGIYDHYPNLEQLSINRYGKIFFLEKIAYQKDYARIEDENESDEIGRLLFDAYTNLGYEIKTIPNDNVENRIKLILSNI